MQYFNGCNYDRMPFILHQTYRYLFIMYNITDYDGDSFLWTNNINVLCKPPTHVFKGKVRHKRWGQYTSKYGKHKIPEFVHNRSKYSNRQSLQNLESSLTGYVNLAQDIYGLLFEHGSGVERKVPGHHSTDKTVPCFIETHFTEIIPPPERKAPPRSEMFIPSWSQAQEKEEGWAWD
jgi:hypothetical protein